MIRISAYAGSLRAGVGLPEAKAALTTLTLLRASRTSRSRACVLGVGDVGRRPVERQGERADQGAEGGDGGDEGAGLEVDDAAELDGDRDDRVPGGGEGAERGEPEGAVGARGCQPAQALDAVRGEAEQGGEDAADEDEDLEAARVAVDGEVAGERGGPGPGEEGGDDGEGAAAGGEGAADGGGDGDEARGCSRGRGAGRLGCGGLCGHRCHALSATRSPSRPCGLNEEYEDEEYEGPDVGPGLAAELRHAGDVGDVGGGHGFGEAEDEAADHGSVDVADAAEDGGGEGLEAEDEAHAEVDLAVLEPVGQASDGGEGGAEGEGDHDDRSVLMPMSLAVSGSWAVACMPRPVRVFITK